MKKILIITNEFNSGGIGKYIRKIIPSIHNKFDIFIVSRDNISKEDIVKFKIKEGYAQKIPSFLNIWPLKEILFFFKGVSFFKNKNFDIILSNYAFYIPYKIKSKTKIIEIFHSLHKQFVKVRTPKKFFFMVSKILHFLLIPLDIIRIKRADKNIFISKYGYNLIESKNKSFIPNPIGNLIKCKNYTGGKINILCAGRNDPLKGKILLKKFLKYVNKNYNSKYSNIFINVVGLKINMKNNNVGIIEKLNFNQMERIYKNSDIIISFSYIENTPNLILESLQYGKIILSSDVGDCFYILKENKLLFDPNNFKSLIEKFDYIINNISKVSSSIKIIRKRVYKEYNYHKVTKKILEIIS